MDQTHCDVCGRPLSPLSRMVTGACQRCISEGAAFACEWMADLRSQGRTLAQVGEIVGRTGGVVGARLSERRRAAA